MRALVLILIVGSLVGYVLVGEDVPNEGGGLPTAVEQEQNVGGSLWNTNLGRLRLTRSGNAYNGTLGEGANARTIVAEREVANQITGWIIYNSGLRENFRIWIAEDGMSFTGEQGMGTNNNFNGVRVR